MVDALAGSKGPIDAVEVNEMQTIDEVRVHGRFVGKGIERMGVMTQFVKCCLVVALGFAVAGCSKRSSGGSGGGGSSSRTREHKKVQLWKDGPYWGTFSTSLYFFSDRYNKSDYGRRNCGYPVRPV